MTERWHVNTSGSQAGTHFGCPPSGGAFPRAHTTSTAAERGNEIHEYCRAMSVMQGRDWSEEGYEEYRKTTLARVPEEYRNTCAGLKFGEVLDGLTVIGAEHSFAVNVKERTARFIGIDIHRDYAGALERAGQSPLQAYEIPLSIDIVARASTGTIVELDWKSGRHLGDPAANWQRRLSSIALMFFYGEEEAISRVAYIWDDGRVQHDGCDFTYLDAVEFCAQAVDGLDRVRAAMVQVLGGTIPTVYPSDDGCKYCSSFAYCPYWTTFAKNMAGIIDGLPTVDDLETIDLDALAAVLETVKKAEKIFEVLGTGLKAIASETPIPLGPDHEYRKGESSRTSFDQALARGLLVRLGATEEQLADLYRKNTFDEFRRRKRILPLLPEGEAPVKKPRKPRTPKVVDTPLEEAP